ncbi:hypothetical protein N0V88_006583 [Collariella sp. IMI 366227]|nr:hypothetical protein N0V88_006583 [Collariella sp. IMI 366227]
MKLLTTLTLTAAATALPSQRRTTCSQSKGFRLITRLLNPAQDLTPSISGFALGTIHTGAGQNAAILASPNPYSRVFYQNGTAEQVASHQTTIITDSGTPPFPSSIITQKAGEAPRIVDINVDLGTANVIVDVGEGKGPVLVNGLGEGGYLACERVVPYYQQEYVTLQYLYGNGEEEVPEGCARIELVPDSRPVSIMAQLAQRELEERGLVSRDLEETYPERYLQVPVDHFHNDSLYEPHSSESFPLRYWFDAQYYKKGGPVIVLQSGETSGVGRLPFLQKGIVAQLAQATHGLGVILEHRYYGKSYPTSDFSTDNLRFLTTDQAVADMAYFAQHVKYEGLEHLDLTSAKTPYIAYGGSYAGSFVAFLRKLYPDVYWGAIASSGVPEAIYDYWQYYEAHRLFAPKDCVVATQKLTHVVDNILLKKKDTEYVQRLKTAFGLGNLTRNDDFAYTISWGIGGLQGLNWDPAENSTEFGYYCNNMTSQTLLYPVSASAQSEAKALVKAGGYEKEANKLTNQLLNYIGYVNTTMVQTCGAGKSQDSCFTSYNTTFYQQDDLKQSWRLWAYQYCFEWGYLQSGSGVPATQLPLISRLIDIPFLSVVCREAFNITTPSKVERINKHGGVHISYPRLAHVDGEWDPWRYASPHRIGLRPRRSTIKEPFILVDDAVHHWDENGVFANETRPGFPPRAVAEAQREEMIFVKAWLEQWKWQKCNRAGLRYGSGLGDL